MTSLDMLISSSILPHKALQPAAQACLFRVNPMHVSCRRGRLREGQGSAQQGTAQQAMRGVAKLLRNLSGSRLSSRRNSGALAAHCNAVLHM